MKHLVNLVKRFLRRLRRSNKAVQYGLAFNGTYDNASTTALSPCGNIMAGNRTLPVHKRGLFPDGTQAEYAFVDGVPYLILRSNVILD